MEFHSELPPERLRVALSSVCYSSVDLHDSLMHEQPPPAALPSLVVSALARSARTLTALHGLPWVEPADHPEAGLAAFICLLALTVIQTGDDLPVLRATHLPRSLEDVKLVLDLPEVDDDLCQAMPLLADFDRLRHLQKITVVEYRDWQFGREEDDMSQQWFPALLPPSLRVRVNVPLFAVQLVFDEVVVFGLTLR